MASLNSLYLKTETLETLLKTVKTKGEKGVEITISLNDIKNEYGQNVSAYVSQTKEQREAKKPKFYVGNGKTFWISNGEKPVETVEAQVVDDDLPF